MSTLLIFRLAALLAENTNKHMWQTDFISENSVPGMCLFTHLFIPGVTLLSSIETLTSRIDYTLAPFILHIIGDYYYFTSCGLQHHPSNYLQNAVNLLKRGFFLLVNPFIVNK